jgi:hypothetical protein
MASLAEMERELPVERLPAGLEVARQLGRKRQMTDSNRAVKKLLINDIPPRDEPSILACRFLCSTAGFQLLRFLNLRFLQFPETTPVKH